MTVPPPAAPVISSGMVNANDSVTLTGTRAGRGHGDGVGWRLERARHHDGEQQRRLELHHGGLVVRHLCLHRHRHDVGGDQHGVERVRCDGAAPRGPVISSGMVNANDTVTLTGTRAGRGDGDGVGWRLERARHHDGEQQRQLELHHGGLVGRHLRLHRHRHDVGGDQHGVERVRCDGAARPRLR